MTPAGWMLMVCSLGLVIGLTGFCYWRVLTRTGSAHGAETKDNAA